MEHLLQPLDGQFCFNDYEKKQNTLYDTSPMIELTLEGYRERNAKQLGQLKRLKDFFTELSNQSDLNDKDLRLLEGLKHFFTNLDNPVFGNCYDGSYYKCSMTIQAGTWTSQQRPPQVVTKPPTPTGNGSKSQPPILYLFSVLVALEWQPSDDYLRQLEWAFRYASDFLYDVTNGHMAFGQVIFGGPKLMPAADIQIVRSNRILPRSWRMGMHQKEKYQPIRIGRNFWDARRGMVIDWDEPEGFRILVHEWGHYALGLVDAYLTAEPQQNPQFVVPKFDPDNVSIMAHVIGTSEITQTEWNSIKNLFDDLPNYSPNPGPGRLPLPLPQFHYVAGLTREESSNIGVQELGGGPIRLPSTIHPEIDQSRSLNGSSTPSCATRNYWCFAIRPGDSPELQVYGAPNYKKPRQEQPTEEPGFQLDGTIDDKDIILLVKDAYAADDRSQDSEIYIQKLPGSESPWKSLQKLGNEPIIAVLPVLEGGNHMLQVHVHIQTDSLLHAWLFLQGQEKPRKLTMIRQNGIWISDTILENAGDGSGLLPLDGHVLIEVEGSYRVATYSRGGGPATHTGTAPLSLTDNAGNGPNPKAGHPISAGSSDGNVMLFFGDARKLQEEINIEGKSIRVDDYYKDLRIITTANYIPVTAPKGRTQYSAVYAVATNQSLPKPSENVLSTLITHFNARRKPRNASLCSLKKGGWKPVTSAQEFEGYIAKALQLEHKLTFFQKEGGVDYFCLFEGTAQIVNRAIGQRTRRRTTYWRRFASTRGGTGKKE